MFQAIRYFRSERRTIVLVGIISFVNAIVDAASLLLFVPVARTLADGKRTWSGTFGPIDATMTVNQLLALAAVAILCGAALSLLVARLRGTVTARWEERRREELISDFLAADWPTQASERSGNLPTLLGYTNRGSNALAWLMLGVKAILTMAVFITIALIIRWQAAALILVAGGLLVAAMRPLVKRIRGASQLYARQNKSFAQEMAELASGARDIAVFDAREALDSRVDRLSKRMGHERSRQVFLLSVFAPGYQYGGLLFMVAALGVAGAFSQIDIAVVGAIALLLLRSLSYGQQFQGAFQSVIESMPFIEHLDEAVAVYQANPATFGDEELGPVETIRLDDVAYSYDGSVSALDGLSIDLHPGRIVGVVGPSGSGKSTMSQILLRLRRPDSGEYLVNGRPASSFTHASWCRHFALVPQDPRLFHATVAENISLFSNQVTRDDIVEAARNAGIHDTIAGFELGYDTPVGAAFHDLSGGQIQRIGIARALVRKPDVIVLDEPTSALDVHSEALVQDTLEALRGKATLVIIAHRLSTLSICDELVVLERGRLTAAGAIAEVRETNPFFRKALETGSLDVDRAVS